MNPSEFTRLGEWLDWLTTLHAKAIDMGLERAARVRAAMNLAPAVPVVIVGGTNGKGSVCAMLSTMLNRAGYRVGTYTSPHILHYNERVAIDMAPVDDARLMASFRAVEAARGDVTLSYFEFGTLAAVHAFIDEKVDVIVLEVGLGGRLDAVNLFDADVAAVVSVDLDHQAFLGNDRESIGFEKAGIFRAGRPAVCADPAPPASLVAHAQAIGADLRLVNRDYSHTRLDHQWSFHMGEHHRHSLPLPALRGAYQIDNAACALAILDCLASRLPVDQGAVKRGLLEVDWPGRFQVLPGRPVVVMDVGHNPHAVRAMVANLRRLAFAENRYAVFSMLEDKDMDSVLALAKDEFDGWFVGGLDMPRGQSGERIAERMAAAGVRDVRAFGTVEEAWHAALSAAGENDRIVVFGSFHTVADVMTARQRHH
ncbi:bifunctional tetrahydrofolate synthase/dihydrofolate synthase [Paludibacterium paludis]|uniref:Dihydrofolate synthase/folylpolyglutamate synthase n=1 Tax=Paludibacterium paludis TaxID=1225769 RepID=A0A918P707_9NEIS|nr:bifunctional tetrahydrofolate synthase/dihydrofolate synthase [Paludibacterium paludis]GGY25001.1 bifunctional folylpolyglutamate synthase/dihydrofolate synthase [Paludibacterium paludis]